MRKQRVLAYQLMIVVAIILIIAAIAIPNLLRARMQQRFFPALRAHDCERRVSPQPILGTLCYLAALRPASPCISGIANACVIDNNLGQQRYACCSGKAATPLL